MQIKMKMPDLATSASAVTILKWLVEVGQPIKRGQPLVEIETDKAVMEVESFVTGTLMAVHARADEDVEVGAVIATIEVSEPTVDQSAGPPAAAAPPTSEADTGPQPSTAPKRRPAARPAGGMFARNRAAAEKRDAANEPEREQNE
jgi:pyruvate dehydrogenase E2 component (dihydrolipoamide acetyltransferase)